MTTVRQPHRAHLHRHQWPREGATILSVKGCRPTWRIVSGQKTPGRNPHDRSGLQPCLGRKFFEWTKDAITTDSGGQLREEFQILTYVQEGLITGFPGGTPFGSAGFSINCPIVQRLN